MAARVCRRPILAVAAIAALSLAFTAVPLPAQSYKVLFDFSTGAQPVGGLFLLENGPDLDLLGTTTRGGSGVGTFFTYVPLTNAFFESPFDASTGTVPASHPSVRLGLAPFGTTQAGGASGLGTIWWFPDIALGIQSIHDFAGGDGSRPLAPLVDDPGEPIYGFFGTTVRGGASDRGVLFHLKQGQVGFDFTVLHNFDGAGGAFPLGSVLLAADGFLYGTTSGGGANALGTIYRVETSGNNFQVVHDFVADDGISPVSELIQASDGNLYGTAMSGGKKSRGTVFGFDPKTLKFSVIHDFKGGDGMLPTSAVLEGSDGFLYGTASLGGAHGQGTIFRLETSGKHFKVQHDFTGADGAQPTFSVLVEDAAGKHIYGTTSQGGANGGGVLFELRPK